jgi:uncharacterized protein
MSYRFTFAQADLTALPSGGLFWAAENLLIVSDLHLGKSERLARRGGALLPPYENRASLQKLDLDIEATGARRVLCLGDSFDDLTAADHLDEADHLWLTRLMAGREWIWVEGNHDAGPAAIGGTHRAEAVIGGLAFRHIATPGTPEISGHYHPKARLPGRTAPCFLIDGQRIILPAYGAYTGGLWCDHPDLMALMHPRARAVLTGTRCLVMPMRC